MIARTCPERTWPLRACRMRRMDGLRGATPGASSSSVEGRSTCLRSRFGFDKGTSKVRLRHTRSTGIAVSRDVMLSVRWLSARFASSASKVISRPMCSMTLVDCCGAARAAEGTEALERAGGERGEGDGDGQQLLSCVSVVDVYV